MLFVVEVHPLALHLAVGLHFDVGLAPFKAVLLVDMAKTESIRTFGSFQCQITNTIITPSDVKPWYPVLALNFNEDEY